MQIQINGDFTRSDALEQHITDEVTRRLSHHENQITRVEVHLGDVNADKGGLDKRCTLEVRISGQPAIAVHDMGDNYYDVVSSTCEKAGRAVSHKLERLHDKRS